MYSKFFATIWIVIAIFCCISVNAADVADTKIGVLDIQKLMTKTKETNKAMIGLRQKYAAQSRELVKQQKTLAHTIKKYNKTSDKLKLADLERWQVKIEMQRRDLKEKYSDLQREIYRSQNLEITEIVGYFSESVIEIAKKRGLELVLFKDTTMYNLKTLDITDEVIKLSNKNPRFHKKNKNDKK